MEHRNLAMKLQVSAVQKEQRFGFSFLVYKIIFLWKGLKKFRCDNTRLERCYQGLVRRATLALIARSHQKKH